MYVWEPEVVIAILPIHQIPLGYYPFKGNLGVPTGQILLSKEAANQENQIFLLCQISPSASSTRDLGTRLRVLGKQNFLASHLMFIALVII